MRELHSTPYSAHPGIQGTIARVRRSFYLEGNAGGCEAVRENCPVCQMEKSDHTLAKGKLIKNRDNQDPQGRSILAELPQGEIQ